MRRSALMTLVLLSACQNQVSFKNIPLPLKATPEAPTLVPTPIPTPEPTPIRVEIQESFEFGYGSQQKSFRQDRFDENKTSLIFEMTDPLGRWISTLNKSDVLPIENGVVIQNFELKSEGAATGTKLDLVFALDTTGSLSIEGTINTVKATIKDFVESLKVKNISARLCLVTYKDVVDRACQSFVEDNPQTPENENLNSFLNDVLRIKPDGGEQPKENHLGALVAAAKLTPWGVGHQRMIVLFGEGGFWVKPIDQDEREAWAAPTYPETLDAIKKSQAQVFVIHPKWHGFSSDYFDLPGIPRYSNGRYFDLRELEKGKITVNAIYDAIRDQMKWTHVLSFVAEQNPGINGALPLSQRHIDLRFAMSVQNFRVLQIDTNFPNGHGLPKSEFDLASSQQSPVRFVRVWVNGHEVSKSQFAVGGQILRFISPPPPDALITAEFELGSLVENISFVPVIVRTKLPKNLKITVNGVRLSPNQFFLRPIPNQLVALVEWDPQLFSESDPLKIRELKKVQVSLEYHFDKMP
ncbi:MAG: VWA domain-containing protein [Oligoflexia bacterium]|nr:VWA domain-containing protein [Oligoflexia bacterium]